MLKLKPRPSVSKTRSNNTKSWYAALLILLTSVGGLTWLAWLKTNPFVQRQPIGVQNPVKGSQLTPPGIGPPVVTRPQVYRLQSVNNRLELVPVAVDSQQQQPEAKLRETLNHLFNDPQSSNLGTAIPTGTHLESLQLRDGAIYIDLSPEFRHGGGSSSMIYRVAQVLYTATSLDPTAKVYLSIEGQPIDEAHPLGGEGLLLARPLTRQVMEKEFSLMKQIR